MSRGINTKPPNVLVLCGDPKGKGSKHSDSIFSAARESLVSSLDSERYVVYPLPLEDVSRAPWRDNCRLLVVPSGLQLTDVSQVLEELESYVSNGGALLSVHSPTNAAFGSRISEGFQSSRLVEITGVDPELQPNEWIVAQTSASHQTSPGTLPGVLPTLPPQKMSRVLARMRVASLDAGGPGKNGEAEKEEGKGKGEVETSDCIQHLEFEGSWGQVVLSHVDLLSSAGLGEFTASISELVTLKKDTQKVSNLLREVLKEMGMECCKGESVTPTLSYIMCSDQVSISVVSDYLASC